MAPGTASAAEREVQMAPPGSPVLEVPPLAPVSREAEALHGPLERQPVAKRTAARVQRVRSPTEVVVAGAHAQALAAARPDERQVDRAARVVSAAAGDV